MERFGSSVARTSAFLANQARACASGVVLRARVARLDGQNPTVKRGEWGEQANNEALAGSLFSDECNGKFAKGFVMLAHV